MGDLSDFEKGEIAGARLAGAFLTKTATLLGVSRMTVSKVMLAYTNHGKKASAKRNSGRKSTLTERRIASQNRRSAAAQVIAELTIHLEDSVSTKTA
jgi:transposase